MSVLTALIFSSDALAAALIGAAVELDGFVPVYPMEDEGPREALLRARPAIALVDCDHEVACSEAFFGPAMMMGTRVAVFSSSRSKRALDPIAAQFSVRVFGLPIELSELSEILKGG